MRSAGKKVTMKDIAEELDVSLATVSYVLNHSKKEKISHDMRIKVHETAKRLGYVPSSVIKKNHMIGIAIHMSKDMGLSKKYHYMGLAAEFDKQLQAIGYCTSIKITDNLLTLSESWSGMLEAMFVINMEEKNIRNLTSKYYIPIVFIDSDFDDAVFWKILPDYERLIRKGMDLLKSRDVYVVTEPFSCKRVMESIKRNVEQDSLFLDNGNSNLKRFLSLNRRKKGIIIGEYLGLQVERFMDNEDFVVITYEEKDGLLDGTKRIPITNEKLAKTSVGTLKKLLDLNYEQDDNGSRILIQE